MPDEVEHVVARLEEAGVQAHVMPGQRATVIGAIGERELIAALPLEGYAGGRPRSADPQAVQARLTRDLARPDGDRGVRAADRRRLLRLHRRAVHGREPRADARHRASRRWGRLHDAPRRHPRAADLREKEAAYRAADVLGTQGYDVDVAPELS